VLQQKAAAAAQLGRLKARSEATCDRLKSDITSIRQQKVREAACLLPSLSCYMCHHAQHLVSDTVRLFRFAGAADAAD
jgi:hypothetical protein